MDIKEILTKAEESTREISDLLDDLAAQNKEVAERAQAACDRYFDDVNLRKKNVQDRIAMLEKQKNDLDAKAEGAKEAVVRAASTGNEEAFSETQDSLAIIEARKAAVVKQISMLTIAHVRGKEDLYRAVCDASNELKDSNTKYEGALDEIHEKAKVLADRWNKIMDGSEYEPTHGNSNYTFVSCKGAKVNAVSRVIQHYNAPVEEKKKATEKKPEEQSEAINMETFRGYVPGCPSKQQSHFSECSGPR